MLKSSSCTLDEILLLATLIPFFQFQTFTIMSCSVPTESIYLRFGANACTQKSTTFGQPVTI